MHTCIDCGGAKPCPTAMTEYRMGGLGSSPMQKNVGPLKENTSTNDSNHALSYAACNNLLLQYFTAILTHKKNEYH